MHVGRTRSETLSAAAAQPHVVPGDLAATTGRHARLVTAAEARLVVFPELSLTGYHLDVDPLDPDDPRLRPLVEACGQTSSTALVGAVVHDGARRIAVLEVTGAGVDVAYLKMSLGEEEGHYVEAGTRPGLVLVDGWRVGLGVCKDTRIPDHLEATMAQEPDLYVAGLVHGVVEHGELEERALRIASEHRVPVVLASHAGWAGHGIGATAGGSGIWSASGDLLVSAGADPDVVVGATLTA